MHVKVREFKVELTRHMTAARRLISLRAHLDPGRKTVYNCKL
jgi:hypothetical protein